MAHAIIQLKDHPHNDCKAAKLEWYQGDRSVYSVKAGFIAVVGFDPLEFEPLCVDHTFQSKSEAIDAISCAA